ncbi:MAG TPA: peroxidase family protein [Thermoanaerobaculia bacterium]
MRIVVSFVLFLFSSTAFAQAAKWSDLDDCVALLLGPRKIARERDDRFLGKVAETTARCRGGERAVAFRGLPWIDWANYWATADDGSTSRGVFANVPHLGANGRGVDGALLDLEYQRMELIKFNLFDNAGTYEEFIRGANNVAGPALKQWTAMRLPESHPSYAAITGPDGRQQCKGDLIRFRNLTGICNDLRNPAMGSTNMLFARNAQFESTFPDLGKNELARNRHGERLGLLTPDPQVVSRVLFSRDAYSADTPNVDCNLGLGTPDNSTKANCGYQGAPFFNVLAAFWIQFMTHDWFSHLVEGANAPAMMKVGCDNLTPEQVAKIGCRPGDVIDRGLVAQADDPASFTHKDRSYLTRAYRTMQNTNTAWWDASQIYGYDERSRMRVKRDPNDRARLHLEAVPTMRPGAGEKQGYLPAFGPDDPIIGQWKGQETAGFPDNWSIGMSFYHTVFSREHNQFVDEFRRIQKATPDADSGLRNPSDPAKVIRYRDVTDDELFEMGRLVVSAMIAKIHTIEWTPQLLYDEPLFNAMNANWSGLFAENKLLKRVSAKIVDDLSKSTDPFDATILYSVVASGAGIFGTGSTKRGWSLANLDDVNGGVNHFGSPFNFPEEFVTVYRLHPLVPDLLEYREWNNDPNQIRQKVSVMSTVRGKATPAMREHGLANWALTMGRQRLGLLTLGNHPRFLQNLPMPRLTESPTQMIDVVALDLIRDRERGVPRFNEFRRQYGLRQLRSFDDFLEPRSTAVVPIERQKYFVAKLRELYGQHKCDASKIITAAQRNPDGTPINDCLGFPDGTMVDNIEDVDTVVGWLAEFSRPHGFAISETQFQVFILNASRRLFSDRFFTSSFRPEFYGTLGVQWVSNNGPGPKRWEPAPSNGHKVEVSPLKRVLLRVTPELEGELKYVVNAFDPWARDRGKYYSIDWTPRMDAKNDPAFAKP